MAFSNSMTKLINKIERRIGSALLNLPENLQKDKWANVIIEDTLETFSRYYPHKIEYTVYKEDASTKFPDYFHIDEDRIPGDITIFGLRDINFSSLYTSNVKTISEGGIQSHMAMRGFSFEELALRQTTMDMDSVVNYGTFVEYVHPHLIKISTSSGLNLPQSLDEFKVELFIKHADNLQTISPTKMETFEKLAIIDIKIFLWATLKHFSDLETVFGTMQLNIDDWESAEDDRESLIEYLEENYVAADNTNQPMMYTI